MRRPVIAGNWKMHKSIGDVRSFFDTAFPLLRQVDHCEMVVAPPFTALQTAVERTRGTRIHIAAQDVHWEKSGAFTGEVSAPMLVDAGCDYVIIGHSERRQMFGDTDEVVARKVRSALDSGLKVIACVGETLAEREADRAVAVVRGQVRGALGALTVPDLSPMIVAYEPVWAIGTGRVATPETAAEMHAAVRSELSSVFGEAAAGGMRILYGGSVKPDNIRALMAQEEIDGVLVGGASLDPASFAAIVRYL